MDGWWVWVWVDWSGGGLVGCVGVWVCLCVCDLPLGPIRATRVIESLILPWGCGVVGVCVGGGGGGGG